MNDLWTEVMHKCRLAEVALKEISDRGRDYAQAEAEYRTALAETMLRLKADGKPATIIPDVARGTRHVANLKLKRDCAEALFLAAKEAHILYRQELKILNDQLAREYQG